MVKIIKKLEDLGLFSECVKCGLISANVLMYRDVYENYLKQKEKHSNAQAITNTAEDFHISEQYVYKIIKKLNNFV